jgi:hypothetical protein
MSYNDGGEMQVWMVAHHNGSDGCLLDGLRVRRSPGPATPPTWRRGLTVVITSSLTGQLVEFVGDVKKKKSGR